MAGTDPLSKLLLEAAFMAAIQGCKSLSDHHKDNRKLVDAADNTIIMLNSALTSLITQL